MFFEAVLESHTYNPHGPIWSESEIREKLGAAAAEGFIACGGRAVASISERDRPFVLKSFTDAYVAAVTADPKLALPPAEQRDPLPEPASRQ